jgi:hypothetical protein
MKRISLMVVPLGCLAVIHLSVLLAGFVSPYDFAAQDRELPYSPPTRIHWISDKGRLLIATKRTIAYATRFMLCRGERNIQSAEWSPGIVIYLA